jgi:hypothetical protein
MHQTTVRFGPDLWEALERECADLGVSVAQYVRESALARLMYSAGRRGNPELEMALIVAAESEPAKPALGRTSAVSDPIERAELGIAESSAVWAQGAQALQRAQALREEILRDRVERESKRKR